MIRSLVLALALATAVTTAPVQASTPSRTDKDRAGTLQVHPADAHTDVTVNVARTVTLTVTADPSAPDGIAVSVQTNTGAGYTLSVEHHDANDPITATYTVTPNYD